MYSNQQTVDMLTHAYEELKSTNDQRLKLLEQKTRMDPVLEEKLERINQSIDTLQSDFHRRQAINQRPHSHLGMDCPERAEEKQAFYSYMRHGDESGVKKMEQKALSTDSESDGKFLIPEVISDRIKTVLEDLSVIRRLANVTTVSTSSIDYLIEKNVSESGWVTELQARDTTKTPEIKKVSIHVHELYAKPKATQKLLDDAKIDVESWLVDCIARKMAQLENLSFINGDGVHKPRGFLSYPSVSSGEGVWGKIQHHKSGAKGSFLQGQDADVLFEMIESLKPEYHKGAVWLMSRSAHAAIRKLKDANQNYLWQPGLGVGVPATLLGYPVEISDDMPILTHNQVSASLAFGNFREGYQIVDRHGIRVLRDPYSAKPHVEFYTTRRVGGCVVNFEAIKILQFSD